MWSPPRTSSSGKTIPSSTRSRPALGSGDCSKAALGKNRSESQFSLFFKIPVGQRCWPRLFGVGGGLLRRLVGLLPTGQCKLLRVLEIRWPFARSWRWFIVLGSAPDISLGGLIIRCGSPGSGLQDSKMQMSDLQGEKVRGTTVGWHLRPPLAC